MQKIVVVCGCSHKDGDDLFWSLDTSRMTVHTIAQTTRVDIIADSLSEFLETSLTEVLIIPVTVPAVMTKRGKSIVAYLQQKSKETKHA